MGQEAGIAEQDAVTINEYSKRTGLTHFLKGKLDNGSVEVLADQSSAMLSSFIQANCLIRLKEDDDQLSIGNRVKVYTI